MKRLLYAIGDIHGHYDALASLMAELERDGMVPERDTVVFLGDYVDRGPHSREVVDLVRSLTERHRHWWALRGNHEQMMIDALEHGPEDWATWTQWWYQGGRETVASFAGVLVRDVQLREARVIPADLLDWLHERPFGYQMVDEGYCFVHAGLRPGPLAFDTTEPHDMIWIRDEFLDSDFDFGCVVVHGHTPVSQPVVRPNRIGIDTVLRTRRLTAVELSGPDPRFIQSN